VASRADIHRTQVTLIESGRRLPRAGTLLKLAAALEVDLTTLFGGIAYRPRLFSAAGAQWDAAGAPFNRNAEVRALSAVRVRTPHIAAYPRASAIPPASADGHYSPVNQLFLIERGVCGSALSSR
jgi:transcriptional regulator with XRE-family HTH domain